ncbi:MAG: HNH endonuclease [Ginsengibacter sp.]
MHDIDFTDNEDSDIRKHFTKAGTLKRVRIPEWCKKAVFFRDRGHCCICNKDLSGSLSINNKKHYDHVVPLAQGGLNDIANIQLLCDSCNAGKGGRGIETSNWYERWY